MAQLFPAAQEQTEAIQHVLPRRAAAASTRPRVAAHSLFVAEVGPLRLPPFPHCIRSSLQKRCRRARYPGPHRLAVSREERGLGTDDPGREGTASGEGKCISPSLGGGPGWIICCLTKILTGSGCLCLWIPRGHGESWTDQLRTPLILPLASRQQWAVRESHQMLYSHTLCQTMEPGKHAPHTQTPPQPATGQVPAFTFTFSHFADAFIQSDLQLGNT